MDKKQMTFVQACRDFFGLKEGQGLKDIMLEIKALTLEDRTEIKTGLEANGYEITSA